MRRSRFSRPSVWGNLFTLTLSTRSTLGVERDQLPCRPTGTAFGNCQEMETPLVWACYTPQQPLQNHLSGHLEGGWCCDGQRKCWMDNITDSWDHKEFLITWEGWYLWSRDEKVAWQRAIRVVESEVMSLYSTLNLTGSQWSSDKRGVTWSLWKTSLPEAPLMANQ